MSVIRTMKKLLSQSQGSRDARRKHRVLALDSLESRTLFATFAGAAPDVSVAVPSIEATMVVAAESSAESGSQTSSLLITLENGTREGDDKPVDRPSVGVCYGVSVLA
ncbi:MAG: hypothetical protein KDB22_23570 [Planctomycetales bacterium]|nr:hypothetical protein [Planctomycetales bacterium]